MIRKLVFTKSHATSAHNHTSEKKVVHLYFANANMSLHVIITLKVNLLLLITLVL